METVALPCLVDRGAKIRLRGRIFLPSFRPPPPPDAKVEEVEVENRIKTAQNTNKGIQKNQEIQATIAKRNCPGKILLM